MTQLQLFHVSTLGITILGIILHDIDRLCVTPRFPNM